MQTLKEPDGGYTAAPRDGAAPPLHGLESPQSGQHPWCQVDPGIHHNTGDDQSPKLGILPADA